MGLFDSVRRRWSSWQEAWFHADTPDGDLTAAGGDFDAWGDLEARRARYALAWASYQNTAYRDFHRWAQQLRKETGLYKFARSIYNPTFRLTEFHVAHTLGGPLDPNAGDGKEAPTALPIDTELEAVRPALAQLWRDSRWQRGKAIWTRNGVLNGDTVLKVVHDPARGKVTLDVVHPKHLKWVAVDAYGNVQGYILERRVIDPRQGPPAPGQRGTKARKVVGYEERCFRDGDTVTWETYLIDGTAIPWDWRDYPAGASEAERVGPVWSEPYGFVPLVLTQHVDLGLDFGLSEAHCALPKIREADDAASALHDQIRKSVRPGWLFSGMNKPTAPLKAARPDGDDDETLEERDRQDVPIIYAKDAASRAYPLVAQLQIADALAVLKDQLDQIEQDFPELRFDRMRSEGSFPSGEALRIARQPAATKIGERRGTYDADLVKAHMMALAIGGYHFGENRDDRLSVFAPFSLDSYRAGGLDHRIGERPVFAVDPTEAAAERQTRYTAIKAGIDAGLPKARVLSEAGYSEADIEEMEQQDEADADRAMERMARQQEMFGATSEDEDIPADGETEDAPVPTNGRA